MLNMAISKPLIAIPALVIGILLAMGSPCWSESATLQPQAPAISASITNLPMPNMMARKYPLGPNDVISLKFFGYPELSHDQIRVQPDGYIILDMLGPINVNGMTLVDLYRLLKEKYSYYYKNPKISIDLAETKPFMVYINGAVLNPGSYEVSTNSSFRPMIENAHPEISVNRVSPLLTSVLTAAGGLSLDADLENIQIKNKLTREAYTVDLLSLLQADNTAQDLYLIPGDIVIVPKLEHPSALTSEKYKLYANSSFSPRTVPVKVFGYVNNPGLVTLPASNSLSLLSAIAAAGGYLKDSAYFPPKVYVLRKKDDQGNLEKLAINPQVKEFQLMSNDVVYVPQKVIPRIGSFFDFATRVVSPFYFLSSSFRNATGTYLLPK